MTTDGASATCPKSMRYGPCGGVRLDGTCEVDRRPCPFVADGSAEAAPPPTRRGAPLTTMPPVLVDVRYPNGAPPEPDDAVEAWWAAMAASLNGCGALLGEHVDNPRTADDAGPLPPTRAIAALSRRGVVTVATVTGRDRDLAGASAVMSGYAAAGAAAVHCVTGDHPAALGLDHGARFGGESMTLLGAAAGVPVAATVAESPASPGDRVGRLLAKQRAGAAMAILNHGGDPDDVIAFADRCRATGVTMPLLAPVPLVADLDTAAALDAFPGLRLPTGLLRSVIAEADRHGTGLRWAEELTRRYARSGRFAGVNLSGGTTSTDPAARLRITRAFVPSVRKAWDAGRTPIRP